MGLLRCAVLRRDLQKASRVRRSANVRRSASSAEAPAPGVYVTQGISDTEFGVEPDQGVLRAADTAIEDEDSPDETMLMARALQDTVCHALGMPTEPCSCALVEHFLSREGYSAERRRCCCAFCGVAFCLTEGGPSFTRCVNIVSFDLDHAYDANYCRLCRGGHCRQHLQWTLTAQLKSRVTGVATRVPKPPLVRIEPWL